jgi:tRNA A-37 threonylcarbamoyl transferase component Bud32
MHVLAFALAFALPRARRRFRLPMCYDGGVTTDSVFSPVAGPGAKIMPNPSDEEPSPEDAPTIPPPSSTPSDDETIPHPSRGGSIASTPGTLKSFGDYELIEEIARGGMGVVYRARHRKLNRIVALKMILSGEFASREAISRFYVEAEAAASLDHPGITPVYEIGEIDQQPFFAMKLITGGSVQSAIAKYEKDTRAAVELLTRVSHAVHHAHQRGILHRDLKPNNILLDETGEPLITDFGLAKITHRDSENTKTGAMMGTPAYMAPEQAAGNKNITTAVDIYSIGAILYRLLTGRQTYEADNALDMVIKAMSEDPAPPRQLKHDVPVDLELICMKCLERDPNRRYASAADVAEDLERWSRGEPVSVRAASLGSLAGVWVKRNLQMAGGAAIVGTICGLILAVLFSLIMSPVFRQSYQLYKTNFPSIPKPLLAIDLSSNDTLNGVVLLFGWPSVVSLCALVSVYVTKPPNRNAAASVGLIAGLFCTGLTLMTGVLGPIMASSIDPSATDLYLVSQAAGNTDNANQFSQQAILHFYPDLREFDSVVRVRLLLQKMTSDFQTGIPIGLWAGALLFMLMVPVVVLGSIHTWNLREKEPSFSRVIARTADFAFAMSSLMVMTIIFFFARPIGAEMYVPAPWKVATTLIVMFASAYTAFRMWAWRYRILGSAISLGMIILFFYEAEETGNAWKKASSYALAQDYTEAQDALQRTLIVNGNDHGLNYFAAILEAFLVERGLGDRDDYRRYCKRLVDIGYLNPEPGFAERAAKAALLLPGTKEEVTDAVALAEKASALDKTGSFWIFLTQSMAKYREGDFNSAIRTVHQFNQKEAFFIIRCTGDIVKAMALHRKGDHEQAKTIFADTTQEFDTEWKKGNSEFQQGWIYDKLIFDIWRKECEKLLATDSP